MADSKKVDNVTSSSNATGNGLDVKSLSSSLELALTQEQEDKFDALKLLSNKKMKSLMNSIDLKDKEIVKLKSESEDGRRIEMVNDLKGQIRELELTIDVLKDELITSKGGKDKSKDDEQNSKEYVNRLILRKTAGSSKKYKIHESREELEQKVTDLEKKLSNRIAIAISKNNNVNVNNADSKADSKSDSKNILTTTTMNMNIGNRNNLQFVDSSDDISRLTVLISEVQECKDKIAEQEGLITKQRKEIERLTKLTLNPPSSNSDKIAMQELQKSYATLEQENNRITKKIVCANEENSLLKKEYEMKVDLLTVENKKIADDFLKLKKLNEARSQSPKPKPMSPKMAESKKSVETPEISKISIDTETSTSLSTSTYDYVKIPLFNNLLDCFMSSGNCLLSLHNQFDENALNAFLTSLIPLLKLLQEEIEKFINTSENSKNIQADTKENTTKKFRDLLKLCDKLGGTVEITIA